MSFNLVVATGRDAWYPQFRFDPAHSLIEEVLNRTAIDGLVALAAHFEDGEGRDGVEHVVHTHPVERIRQGRSARRRPPRQARPSASRSWRQRGKISSWRRLPRGHWRRPRAWERRVRSGAIPAWRRACRRQVGLMGGGGRVAMIGGEADRAAVCGATPIAAAQLAEADHDLLLVTADRLANVPPSGIPVLVLDASGDPAACAALLDAGAADLVGRDADPVEIRARIRATLRRTAPTVCADLAIDAAARRVSRGGRAIALNPRECAVLACLARHRDRAITRAALY